MGKNKTIESLVNSLGKKFSTSLDIDLSKKKSQEIFKWFLASVLFGARISETIACKTFNEFKKEDVLTPSAVLETGWDGLVRILDSGGYVRYDFKTATKLLEITKDLIDEYKGDLQKLHSSAKDQKDLERRIKNLGKGIGDVTCNIFLRELRGIWGKADPLPGAMVIEGAGNLGLLTSGQTKRKMLLQLKKLWRENRGKEKDFSDFEAALLRLAKDFCRKKKCHICVVKNYCMKK